MIKKSEKKINTPGFGLCFTPLFGEEPYPLRLQTFFSATAFRLSKKKMGEGMA
jgi:hypothetical protein